MVLTLPPLELNCKVPQTLLSTTETVAELVVMIVFYHKMNSALDSTGMTSSLVSTEMNSTLVSTGMASSLVFTEMNSTLVSTEMVTKQMGREMSSTLSDYK